MDGKKIAKVADALLSAGFEIDRMEDEKDYSYNNTNEEPRYTGAIELRIKQVGKEGAAHE
jgi:hypothetical protein